MKKFLFKIFASFAIVLLSCIVSNTALAAGPSGGYWILSGDSLTPTIPDVTIDVAGFTTNIDKWLEHEEAGEDIIENGNFEDWTAIETPQYWSYPLYGEGGGAVIEKTTESHTGNYAIYLETLDPNDIPAGLAQGNSTPLEVGEDYEFSVYAQGKIDDSLIAASVVNVSTYFGDKEDGDVVCAAVSASGEDDLILAQNGPAPLPASAIAGTYIQTGTYNTHDYYKHSTQAYWIFWDEGIQGGDQDGEWDLSDSLGGDELMFRDALDLIGDWILTLEDEDTEIWNFTGEDAGTWTPFFDDEPEQTQIWSAEMNSSYGKYTTPKIEAPDSGMMAAIFIVASFEGESSGGNLDDMALTKDGETTNFFLNPSLETWVTGFWTPDDWIAMSQGDEVQVHRQAVAPYAGNYSVRIEPREDDSEYYEITQQFYTYGGESYGLHADGGESFICAVDHDEFDPDDNCQEFKEGVDPTIEVWSLNGESDINICLYTADGGRWILEAEQDLMGDSADCIGLADQLHSHVATVIDFDTQIFESIGNNEDFVYHAQVGYTVTTPPGTDPPTAEIKESTGIDTGMVQQLHEDLDVGDDYIVNAYYKGKNPRFAITDRTAYEDSDDAPDGCTMNVYDFGSSTWQSRGSCSFYDVDGSWEEMGVSSTWAAFESDDIPVPTNEQINIIFSGNTSDEPKTIYVDAVSFAELITVGENTVTLFDFLNSSNPTIMKVTDYAFKFWTDYGSDFNFFDMDGLGAMHTDFDTFDFSSNAVEVGFPESTTSALNIDSVPYYSVSMLGFEDHIDLTDTGLTAIYTVPVGYYLIVTDIVCIAESIDGYATPATLEVGTMDNTTAIDSDFSCPTGDDNTYTIETPETSSGPYIISGGTVMAFNVSASATATTYDVAVSLIGQLVYIGL